MAHSDLDWAAERERHVERMEAQVERFAPGFRERILARHVLGPDDLQATQSRTSAAATSAAAATRSIRSFFRPTASLLPYRTPVRGLYLGSAATFPGGAVHGVPGRAAARLALAEARVARARAGGSAGDESGGPARVRGAELATSSMTRPPASGQAVVEVLLAGPEPGRRRDLRGALLRGQAAASLGRRSRGRRAARRPARVLRRPRAAVRLDGGAGADRPVAHLSGPRRRSQDGVAVALGISGLAAWLALTWRAELQPGEHVLVLAASGVLGTDRGAGREAARGGAGDRGGPLAGGARSLPGARRRCRRAPRRRRGSPRGARARPPRARIDVVVDPLFGEPFMAAVKAASFGARIVQLGAGAGAEATLPSAAIRGKMLVVWATSNFAAPPQVKREAYRGSPRLPRRRHHGRDRAARARAGGRGVGAPGSGLPPQDRARPLSARRAPAVLALGLVLEHLAERVLELGGHPLLEQRQQRLGGQRAQRVDRLDQLVPALVRLAGLVERLPQLLQEQLREGSRDRLAVAADRSTSTSAACSGMPSSDDLLRRRAAAPGWGLRSGRRRAARAAAACASARCPSRSTSPKRLASSSAVISSGARARTAWSPRCAARAGARRGRRSRSAAARSPRG